MATQALSGGNIAKMKALITDDKIKSRMADMLGKESSVFLTSVLDLYTSDGYLAQCDPTKVISECMKAAALKLPVAKALGFCYVIPYKGVPQFQLGYRGYVQLAQRSGQYRYINADMIYEGETIKYDRVTGMLQIAGQPSGDTVIGYFAYFQLLNGFEKCVYWSREKVEAHAKRYSKAWSKPDSPWHTNFDAMALKTVLRQIISKYGVMSVDFQTALLSDSADDRIEADIADNANAAPLTITDAAPAALPEKTETPVSQPSSGSLSPDGEPSTGRSLTSAARAQSVAGETPFPDASSFSPDADNPAVVAPEAPSSPAADVPPFDLDDPGF